MLKQMKLLKNNITKLEEITNKLYFLLTEVNNLTAKRREVAGKASKTGTITALK